MMALWTVVFLCWATAQQTNLTQTIGFDLEGDMREMDALREVLIGNETDLTVQNETETPSPEDRGNTRRGERLGQGQTVPFAELAPRTSVPTVESSSSAPISSVASYPTNPEIVQYSELNPGNNVVPSLSVPVPEVPPAVALPTVMAVSSPSSFATWADIDEDDLDDGDVYIMYSTLNPVSDTDIDEKDMDFVRSFLQIDGNV